MMYTPRDGVTPPAQCDGYEVIPTAEGPWVTACTRRNCTCKTAEAQR